MNRRLLKELHENAIIEDVIRLLGFSEYNVISRPEPPDAIISNGHHIPNPLHLSSRQKSRR